LCVIDISIKHDKNQIHKSFFALILDTMAACLDEQFESLESILAEHLPADVLEKVILSLHGPGSV
jgi:hypothetical protein